MDQEDGDISEAIYGVVHSEDVVLTEHENNDTANINDHGMSEKVRNLANSLYHEFEVLISQYGEQVMQNLMPLIVGILTSMDELYTAKQEADIELELLKDDSLQIYHQYEKEKRLRKVAEERLMSSEDNFYAERNALEMRIENMQNINRMLEIKLKNSQEQVKKFESNTDEMKVELEQFQTRYHDILKANAERAKQTQQNVDYCSLQRSISHVTASSNNRSCRTDSTRSGNRKMLTLYALKNDLPLNDTEFLRNSVMINKKSLQQELEKLECSKKVHLDASTGDSKEMDELNQQLEEKNKLFNDLDAIMQIVGDDNDELNIDTFDNAVLLDDNFYQLLSPTVTDDPSHTIIDQEDEENVEDEFYDSDDEFGTQGINKEIDSLIKENSELLTTKNALNVVKNDLIKKVDCLTYENELLLGEKAQLEENRCALHQRLETFEAEIKDLKHQLTTLKDEEDSIPLSQRKRFTRTEMARVLTERNQYKEKYMELQESIRYTEAMRAANKERIAVELTAKKKSGGIFWSMFSGLFGKPSPSKALTLSHPKKSVWYHAPSDAVKAPNQRLINIKETIQQNARFEACGWSLAHRSKVRNSLKQDFIDIPIPIFCRPLLERQNGLKVWCAAPALQSFAYTRSGHMLTNNYDTVAVSKYVPSQEHYNYLSNSKGRASLDETALQSILPSQGRSSVAFHSLSGISSLSPTEEEELKKTKKYTTDTVGHVTTSHLWVCASSSNRSQIIIIDAQQPSNYIDSFYVDHSHILCIASVPGALPIDYELSFCNGEHLTSQHDSGADPVDGSSSAVPDSGFRCGGRNEFIHCTAVPTDPSDPVDSVAHCKANPLLTTAQATMWIGCKDGHLYIYSSVADYSTCLHRVDLHQPILSIVYANGSVFVGLENASVVVFRRHMLTGEWDFSCYMRLPVPVLQKTVNSDAVQQAVKCMCSVGATNCLWIALQNYVHVVDCISLTLCHSFEAHPRRDAQVRQMCNIGAGVWVSMRMDSNLRLFHAITYQHLQDLDVVPGISRVIFEQSFRFSLIRITSLTSICRRLWVGTGRGVIVTFKCVQNDERERQLNLDDKDFIPWLCPDHCQLSFHGHAQVVKCLVHISLAQLSSGVRRHSASRPTAPDGNSMQTSSGRPSSQASSTEMLFRYDHLVISGGEGYVDFRSNSLESTTTTSANAVPQSILSQSEHKSHLIVWQCQGN